ncbi:UNVERIFIED_CONTAM: putative protein ycf45 [Sesamum latifolium]|uniref:AAA+ ATPase domain-containing protein n=1 Tax=Sesamum latifolium TaxID=2727402 RepID=A0AAW2W9C6_9LAMI
MMKIQVEGALSQLILKGATKLGTYDMDEGLKYDRRTRDGLIEVVRGAPVKKNSSESDASVKNQLPQFLGRKCLMEYWHGGLFYAPSASNTFPASQPRKGPRPQEKSLLDLALKTNTRTSRLVRLPGQVRHGCSGGRIHSPRTASNYVDDDIHSLLQGTPQLWKFLKATLLRSDISFCPIFRFFHMICARTFCATQIGLNSWRYQWKNWNMLKMHLENLTATIELALQALCIGYLPSGIRMGELLVLTCRLGRPVRGIIDMTRDLLEYGKSILFLGRPGVGKTTVIRGISHVLSDELLKRVIIVDTSNEIGGDGDIPHPAIGGARRLQVPDPCMKHKVMIEAVENHMPEVIIVDEIGTEAEVHACRTIAQSGVMLIGSAHGKELENIIKNPILSDLVLDYWIWWENSCAAPMCLYCKVGGLKTVILSDEAARTRNCKKIILERRSAPVFPFLIEMRERQYWVAHRTDKSVDELLQGKKPLVEVRRIDKQFKVVIERWKLEE